MCSVPEHHSLRHSIVVSLALTLFGLARIYLESILEHNAKTGRAAGRAAAKRRKKCRATRTQSRRHWLELALELELVHEFSFSSAGDAGAVAYCSSSAQSILHRQWRQINSTLLLLLWLLLLLLLPQNSAADRISGGAVGRMMLVLVAV